MPRPGQVIKVTLDGETIFEGTFPTEVQNKEDGSVDRVGTALAIFRLSHSHQVHRSALLITEKPEGGFTNVTIGKKQTGEILSEFDLSQFLGSVGVR